MAGKIFSALLASGFPNSIRLCGKVMVSEENADARSMSQPPEGRASGRPAKGNVVALDRLFPFLYGGVLAASLWWIWMTLGRPFHPGWIAAPLLVTTIADWLEGLMLLAQLRHYMSPNQQYAESLLIRLSSFATIIKLWLTSGLYVTLAGLVLKMLFTFPGRRLASDAAE